MKSTEQNEMNNLEQFFKVFYNFICNENKNIKLNLNKKNIIYFTT